jgi:hypothetical protein
MLLLLLAGFAGQFALSLSAPAKKESFASWLNSNVISGDAYQEIFLKNEIKILSSKADDFSGLVQVASRFVLDNKDKFQIPLGTKNGDDQKNSKNIKSWLIDQWTQYQKNMSGQEALKYETNHLYPRWLNQSFNFVKTIFTDFAKIFFNNKKELLLADIAVVQLSPIPFLSGISINAP